MEQITTKGKSMNTSNNEFEIQAKDMEVGEIYLIKGELLLVHEVDIHWADKNKNFRTVTAENWDGDIRTFTVAAHSKVTIS